MRPLLSLCVLGLVSPVLCAAQSACSSAALPQAAQAAIAARHQLHEQAVSENDPKVPVTVATQLQQMKDALSQAADVAFAPRLRCSYMGCIGTVAPVGAVSPLMDACGSCMPRDGR